MANLNVTVVDGNNINIEVTPVPRQTITIDKGIAGVGIESVSIVYDAPYYYLDFQYTNGTSELVQLPAISSGVTSFNTRIGVVTLEFTDVTGALGYTPPEPDGTGATGTWNISVTGNAATVTNGVYTTGTYSDPLWITALAGSKITGDITGNAANVNGIVAVTHGGTGATNAVDARTNLNAANQSTTITAGTGLSGGGDLSANRVISITDTGVTAATKGSASKSVTATVNAQGQLTSLSDQDIAISNSQVSGLGTMSTQNASNVVITGGSITGITDLAIADGGTGASTAADARTNLGLGSAAVLNAGSANGVATLDSAGKVPLSEIPESLIGALNYQGTWNASTNTPTLTSSVGTKGFYYVVSVAGNTNLNGITDWLVGDWAIFDGSVWGKIDNTDAVTSVNGYTGAVVLGYSDVGAPSTSGTNATGTWGINVTGNAGTVTNGVYTTDTGTVTNAMLAGSIANNKLANSTISGVSLGSNLNALTIGSGLSGTSYNGSAAVTITNTAPDQVVSLTGAGTTSISGTYPNFTITSTSATGSVFGPGSSTDNAIVRFDGTTGTLIQNSAVTLDDAGNIINPDSVQFSGTVPATQPIGTLWFDSSTDTLNLQQNAITQQIGEELYVYGKASSAISGQTLLQAIYKTGTVGASGNITFAPTIAGLTDGGAIIGVATEDIAANSFGRITNFGIVHSINTSGSTYGETWADGDDIWYNPVTGGLTKIKPVAPNIKVQIGTVIHAGSGGSGSFQVLLNTGSSLGGTDDNVQITSPASGNALIYDATAGYWKNANLTDGTGINITEGAGSITIANTGVTSITGTASQITASASTGGVTLSLPSTINVNTSGNAANVTGTVAIANGGTGQTTANAAFNALAPSQTGNSGKYLTTDGTNTSWATNPLGTVTSVAMTTPTGLTVSGSPITTSGTLAVSLESGYSIPTTASQTNWDSAYTQRLQWDGGSTNLVASTGRTSLGGTTVGQNFFTLTNPTAVTFPRINADNTVSALDAATFRTAIGAGTGSGSVTSVSGTGTVSGISLSGTVTSSGSLTLGGSLDLSAPPAIGGTTPNTGAFTSLTATSGVVSANTSTDALRITQTGTGNALVVEDSANPDATPFVIDQNGKVILGSTAVTSDGSLQINNTSSFGTFDFNRKNAGVVSADDTLGVNRWHGFDGTTYLRAAQIFAAVDGTPGTNDMPGRLVFSTTADGASSPTERMRIDNAGRVGIGTSSLTGYNLRLGKTMSGTSPTGFQIDGALDSTAAGGPAYFAINPSTSAGGAGVGNLYYSYLGQGSFGTAVTNQFGYYVAANLTGATNNYGFYSNIAAGTGRYNFYAAGTADNYFAGNVGIGNTPPSGVKLHVYDASVPVFRLTNGTVINASYVDASFSVTGTTTAHPYVITTNNTERMRIDSAGNVGIGSAAGGDTSLGLYKTLTGATTAYGFRNLQTIASDVTGNAYSFDSQLSTAASAFTLGSVRHFNATNLVIGAGSSVTSQYGFFAAGNLTGATNNYGFFSNIASGTGRWNFYAAGTADNYFAGKVGIGTTSTSGATVTLAASMDGGSYWGIANQGTVPSTATGTPTYYGSSASTAAASFTVGQLDHFKATQGTFGAGSTVTNQNGFRAESSLTGATNNYGFYSNIASGTGRYNFYAAGSAWNYFAGSVGIGTSDASLGRLVVSGSNLVLAAASGSAHELNIFSNGQTNNNITLKQGFGSSTDNIAFLYNRANADFIFGTNNTERMRIDSSGNVIQSAPTSAPTLSTNGTMVFNLTSNTNLRVSVRGSDGVTRTANITLA